jgi:vesicle coat complex subunit
VLADEQLLGSLSQLIKDSDSLVSINALLALDEILISEGGVPLSSKLYHYLIHRLKEYNEWHQTCVL